MSNSLLPMFRRKLFSFFRKWRGFVDQQEPISVPNMLVLLQYIGFKKPLEAPATENSVTIQIQCSHHSDIMYTLEMPIAQGQCNCMKSPRESEDPVASSSSFFLDPDMWNTRRVFPLRPRDQQLEGYSRIFIQTIIELMVRLTYSSSEANEVLGSEADIAWVLDCLRMTERSRSPTARRSMSEGVSVETLAQISQYIEQAVCYMDISLNMLPEHIRNSQRLKSPTDTETKRDSISSFQKSPFRSLRKADQTPKGSPTQSLASGRSSERSGEYQPRSSRAVRKLSFKGSSPPRVVSPPRNTDNEQETRELSPRNRVGELFSSFKRKFKNA